jgi:DNA-directed RNA polymerase specialized sigma24 family protein
VVEEVFVDLWNRRNEVDLGEKIESYLFRATFTRAINVLHKAHRSEEQLSLLTAINDRRTAFLESEIATRCAMSKAPTSDRPLTRRSAHCPRKAAGCF